MRRRVTTGLFGAAAAFFLVLAVKFFVADVYRVDSSSMRPTLFGGATPDGEELNECVLVAYDRSPELHRFDPVVMRSRDGGNPIVKRVVGLPGETVSIEDGDLLVGGERLPLESPRPKPIVLFDDRLVDLSGAFEFDHDRWTRDGDHWTVDARDVEATSPPCGDAGSMFLHQELRDGYLDPELPRSLGFVQVNDGILECRARMEDAGPAAELRFQLVEEGDTFLACIARNEDGFRLRLLRKNPLTLARPEGPAEDVLAERAIDFEPGVWRHVRFANVDNHVTFHLDGERLLAVDYEANVPNPPLPGTVEKSLVPRVAFGAQGCRASFASIVVLRDLFYTSSGEDAVSSFLALGPDEYFLLGDNSAESSDSRHFGPVHASEIIGRPIAVVWPLSRVRRITGGTEEGGGE